MEKVRKESVWRKEDIKKGKIVKMGKKKGVYVGVYDCVRVSRKL